MPKFVRKYANVRESIVKSVQNYIKDIRQNRFPGPEESYFLGKDIEEFLNENHKTDQ